MADTKPVESIDDLEKRVEAARATRAAKLRANDEVIRRKKLEEEAKLIEIEANEGIIDQDIKAVFSPRTGAMVVVKRPAPVVFQRFQTKVLADKVTVSDLHDLIRSTLIYPDKPTFQTICDETPGLLGAVANAVTDLAGVGAEGLAGK